jgi:hypothetical protein
MNFLPLSSPLLLHCFPKPLSRHEDVPIIRIIGLGCVGGFGSYWMGASWNFTSLLWIPNNRGLQGRRGSGVASLILEGYNSYNLYRLFWFLSLWLLRRNNNIWFFYWRNFCYNFLSANARRAGWIWGSAFPKYLGRFQMLSQTFWTQFFRNTMTNEGVTTYGLPPGSSLWNHD